MRYSYRICGHQSLLPKSLAVPICYDPTETPQCHGGFADVWKGEYGGKEVAAKALRISLKSDLDRIRRVSSPETVIVVNKLTVFGLEVLQRSNDLEHPPPSKCVATGRCNDDQASVCDGIGVDGEWEHQHVCEGKPQC